MSKTTKRQTLRKPRATTLLRRLTKLEDESRKLTEGLEAGAKLALSDLCSTVYLSPFAGSEARNIRKLKDALESREEHTRQLKDTLEAASELATSVLYAVCTLRRDEETRMLRAGEAPPPVMVE
jgi:hypothetical protein